ncbi:hypothetical protein N9J72_02755 [Candidatus Gracilibacteria bacterium]|nr:hypothetical protein [Candidatus Gracilibacteria bacterium]
MDIPICNPYGPIGQFPPQQRVTERVDFSDIQREIGTSPDRVDEACALTGAQLVEVFCPVRGKNVLR